MKQTDTSRSEELNFKCECCDSAYELGIAEGRQLQKIEDNREFDVVMSNNLEDVSNSAEKRGYAKALIDFEQVIEDFDFTNEFWKTRDKLKSSLKELGK